MITTGKQLRRTDRLVERVERKAIKQKIEVKDFVKVPLGYLSYRKGNLEIALEPCLNGCDVAVYKNMELLEPKRCTDIKNTGDPMQLLSMTKKVDEWINDYYRKYFND